MKVTWEEPDIKPGRTVQRPGYGLSGRYIISWRRREGRDTEHLYALVSLVDGMFLPAGSKADLAKMMNEAGYYMPAELVD